jgi:hypothetical protein
MTFEGRSRAVFCRRNNGLEEKKFGLCGFIIEKCMWVGD